METTTDYSISDRLDDTISCLKFSTTKNLNILASTSWDSKLRLWEYQINLGNISGNSINQTAQIQTFLVLESSLTNPIISMSWQGEDPNMFTGCGDGTIHHWDLNSTSSTILGKHEIGCTELIWISSLNVLMSGGWDGKINFWDLRQQNPALDFNLGKKIYSMSMAFPLLVVGMSDRMISYFNLNKVGNNFAPEGTFESPLRYPTRKVACFPEGDGYALGSIEGRIAIRYLNLNKNPEITSENKAKDHKDDYAFRCHRSGENSSEVYPINDMAFNSVYGTFCSGGGDGKYIIWDKQSRTMLKQLNNFSPITAVNYSSCGNILAYASGYDWAQGVAYESKFSPKINLHYCLDQEKKKKPKKEK